MAWKEREGAEIIKGIKHERRQMEGLTLLMITKESQK